MAHIPIERKSGGSWLPWLLGLLLLVGGVWVVAELVDGDDELERVETAGEVEGLTTSDDTRYEADRMTPTGEITSLSALLSATATENMVGRRVNLTNVQVGKVIGDASFFLRAQGTDSNILVFLDEVMNVPPKTVEGRYDVNQNQQISILQGTVRAVDNATLQDWDLDESDMERVKKQRFYIHADKLDILERG